MKQIVNTIYPTVYLLLAFASTGFSQHDPLKFERLSINHGLSQSTVGYIYQDSRGFMWFATGLGLNRYDGYEFEVYKHDPENPNTISNNNIWHIAEDTSGALWIGTYGGLNRFDYETETFTHWQHDPDNVKSIASDYVISLLVDRSDVLWLGTEEAGLLQARKTDSASLAFTQWLHDPRDANSLSNNEVVCIYEDRRGTLWIGTAGGLNRFDRATGRFTRFINQPDNPTSLSNNNIEGISEDESGALWIATHGGGLNRFDHGTETFVRWKHKPGDPNSLSTNYLYSIQIDLQGIIWIGTNNAGLDRFDPVTGTFAHYVHQPANLNSLGDNEVISMLEDRSGILWIGTSEGGLSRLTAKNRTPGAFVHWKNNPANPNSLRHNRIWSFYEDEAGDIWIATTGGLNHFDRKSGLFAHFATDPDNSANLSNYVTSIQGDKDGVIWLATWGGGVHRFDPESATFTPFPYSQGGISTLHEDQFGNMWIARDGDGLLKFNPENESIQIFRYEPNNRKSLSNNNVQCLYEDRLGNLWIGTEARGLNKFDRANETFVHWKTVPDDTFSLSNNEVRCIYEDKAGRLWVGTAGGLNRFDQKTGKFFRYREKEGLPDDVICGILEDGTGNLWLSTHNGLSKFNPATGSFRNYSVQDGLQSNEFNRGGCLKSRNGEMFFGGINGFNSFFPDSIRDNPHIPPVVITDFQVLNKSVEISTQGETPLRKHISESKEIVLSYSDHIFSFEFAALDYNAPERNRYAYRMEGFDEGWIDAGTRRFATYTNLDPGEYVFYVKGSNSDGIWNEKGTAINIIITPPWWQSWWAYTLYAFVIFILLYSFRRFELSKVRLANDLQMQRFEADKLRELDQMKSRFFANISHEFRTPLTLIIGPLKHLLSNEFPVGTKNQFRMMLRNGQRLLRMINQLLDLSRLEADKMTLQTRPENLVTVLKQILSSFESLATRKQIAFTFHPLKEPIIIYLDRDKLEKIMYNLLSNAFKFTPEGGAVSVQVTLLEKLESEGNGWKRSRARPPIQHVQITVRDTGIGIPSDQREEIFDRFYQANGSHTRPQGGTGIGLALTKELVELHGGDIRVESEPGFGSTFTICLPLGREHLKADEIVAEVAEPMGSAGTLDNLIIPDESEEVYKTGYLTGSTKETPPVKEAPILLIVEDNADMRSYIREILAGDYTIIEADEGVTGLEKAVENIPDLVISDVMMRGMDGFDLCRELKTDERTCHIPVILITARASGESKIEGLETGADDYVTKPFDAREIEVRVRNLIGQRRILRERFSREITLQPQAIAVTSLDARFLERAMAVVEECMANSDFTPEKFSRKMAMSRMQLHRKLRALTNQSAGEFIRTMRLKRAARLLKLHKGNIAEIAYEVGFNNLSYFAKCFRELFGQLPSEYVNE